MSWVQLLTLIAMVLVSAAVMSYVFQWLKERLKVPENWRAVILYALCGLVGLAQQWLGGDVLGIVSGLNNGVATATELFAFGSATFALSTACYNVYVRPRALAKAADARSGPIEAS